jgi:hypothetical protein
MRNSSLKKIGFYSKTLHTTIKGKRNFVAETGKCPASEAHRG